MKMLQIQKYAKIYMVIWVVISQVFLSVAYGGTCWPNWDGDRFVESDCDYPVGYKVYGNIYVGDKHIVVNNGVLWLDLTANKIVFTTGTAAMVGAGKIDNSVSTRYSRGITYTRDDSNPVHNCPDGTVLVTDKSRKMNPWELTDWVAQSGTFYCAR